jgi:pimeloyl-ACP methyl ester carboxylesterase
MSAFTPSSAATAPRCCSCTAGRDLVRWRLVMPALARNFTVVAVDQRGIGLSDKPATG